MRPKDTVTTSTELSSIEVMLCMSTTSQVTRRETSSPASATLDLACETALYGLATLVTICKFFFFGFKRK